MDFRSGARAVGILSITGFFGTVFVTGASKAFEGQSNWHIVLAILMVLISVIGVIFTLLVIFRPSFCDKIEGWMP